MSSHRHRDRYYSSSSSSSSDSGFDLFDSDSDDGITVVTVNGKRLTSGKLRLSRFLFSSSAKYEVCKVRILSQKLN